jgi:ABC-type transport system involved in cytochrome c biogenesis ATPase subunit
LSHLDIEGQEILLNLLVSHAMNNGIVLIAEKEQIIKNNTLLIEKNNVQSTLSIKSSDLKQEFISLKLTDFT